MHASHSEKSYHTKCELKYLNKFQKVNSVILQDIQKHAGQFLKRRVEFTLCFFSRYSDSIQLQLFQGLDGLNEAEHKERVKREMERGWRMNVLRCVTTL